MAVLSRQAILAAPVVTKDVETPEWGGSVRMRALSAKSRVLLLDAVYANEAAHTAWKEDQAKPKSKRTNVPRVDLYDQSILSVIFGIVDEKNELIFSLADYDRFTELDYPTIVRLWIAMSELSVRDREDVKKNSA